MPLTFHSSRSRYEAFQKCQRLGFLQYCYQGRGLQRKGKNIFLSTGIWTHKGLEMLCKYVQKHSRLPELFFVDHVCQEMKVGYFNYVFPVKELEAGKLNGFDLADEKVDAWTGDKRELTDLEQERIQQYTINEQTALVEAFLRVFCINVLPRLWDRFKIVTVENDMGFPFVSGQFDPDPYNTITNDVIEWETIQSATIDVVLQERTTKDLYVVSFKTAGRYDNRTAKGAMHDTQGLSELWALEEYLRLKKTPKDVMGIQMLYFIKGSRAETESGSGVWETKSPLIKGYRRVGVNSVEYSHSWYFPKPENKSGKGALGRGWEQFDVWDSEEVGGVKGWVEMLASGTIQPECGDILSQQIIEPHPYYRQPNDVVSWLTQTKAEEGRIAEKLITYNQWQDGKLYGVAQSSEQEMLDTLFGQTRSHCHYPSDCSMLSVCHGTAEQRENPLAGEFEYRVPHHKLELIQVEGKNI